MQVVLALRVRHQQTEKLTALLLVPWSSSDLLALELHSFASQSHLVQLQFGQFGSPLSEQTLGACLLRFRNFGYFLVVSSCFLVAILAFDRYWFAFWTFEMVKFLVSCPDAATSNYWTLNYSRNSATHSRTTSLAVYRSEACQSGFQFVQILHLYHWFSWSIVAPWLSSGDRSRWQGWAYFDAMWLGRVWILIVFGYWRQGSSTTSTSLSKTKTPTHSPSTTRCPCSLHSRCASNQLRQAMAVHWSSDLPWICWIPASSSAAYLALTPARHWNSRGAWQAAWD